MRVFFPLFAPYFSLLFVPLSADMKQLQLFISYATCSALAILGCLSCGGGSSTPSPDFESLTVEKTVNIEDSKGAPQCHVSLQVLQAKNATNEVGRLINKAVVEKIFDMSDISPKAAADSFANTYTRDYRKNMAPLYREDRSDTDKHAWYEYNYVVSTETRDNGNGITNYLITLDYFEGGAHGITQLLTMNFDNQTGRCVTLSDVYGSDYEAQLTEQLLKALLEKTGDSDVDALHQRGYLYSMDMFIPENYIIGDDHVTFIFNPYEIAPYSEGRIELDIKR